MNPDRWQRVDTILQAAMDLPDSEQETFLENACSSEPALLEEVRSLLEAHRRAGAFLDVPAMGLVSVPDAVPGQTFGHFRVEQRLGGGGMGVVYRAEDIRLHRPVALKFVTTELSLDPDALARFRLEARAASALNHPNICTIYDVGEQDGRAFIAMEFLDGVTLGERLQGGPLDRETLLDIASDVLNALDAAHAIGIVHRDIKPANLFLLKDGRTKILDFGVAKFRPIDPGETTVSRSTIDPELTSVGSAIGTGAYMSPEQVRGEPVDARSDIFSLGVVLYEMVTGKRPFAGEGTLSLFESILEAEPVAPSHLNPAVSKDLERIILRCLAKPPERRYQRAAELRADLLRIRSDAAERERKRLNAASWRWRSIAAGLILLVAGLATALLWKPSPVLSEQDTIIVADFENRTGDPAFDGLLRGGLLMQLRQSPYLSVVSDERIAHHLKLMKRPVDAPLAAAVARDVCQRNGSAAVVSGSIASLGTRYVLSITAEHCADGRIILQDQKTATTKDDVIEVLSDMAESFRTGVGESLASVERTSVRLVEATTESTEALKVYTTATRLFASGSPAAAVPLYQRALELDEDFPSAHTSLGMSYSVLGEAALARKHSIRGYELRDRVSGPERFYAIAAYDRNVTGNLERLQRTYEAWSEMYPRDPVPLAMLSALCALGTGQYELAAAASQRAVELDPENPLSYLNVAYAQLAVDRPDAAAGALATGEERGLEIADAEVVRYFIAFLRDDGGMASQLAAVRGKGAVEEWLTHFESLRAARSARLREARRSGNLAVSLATEGGRHERAAMFFGAYGIREAMFGNASAARLHADRALALSNGRDVQYPAAFALARSGDHARARALADDLEQRFPEDTFVRFTYVPTLRAQLALHRGDWRAALDILEPGRRFDEAQHGVAFNGWFGAMYTVYLRGEALLASGRLAEAAKEFERIIDRRGVVLADPIGALARLQRARAFVRSGDVAAAKAAYEDLMGVWKNGDADNRLLIEAKQEYARLR